jgi:hypothetical protein
VISESRFNVVAQFSHFAWAALVVIVAGLWGWEWAAAGLVVAVSAAKEFWYDHLYEPPDVRGSDTLDFVVACVGVTAGLVIQHVAP